MTLNSPRVEADQDVVATASVSDAATPLDRLTYQWSATPVNGTFTAQGPVATWRAPKQQRTPDTYTLTLLVADSSTPAGSPNQRRASSSVQAHYNDSVREITTISTRFLTQLFATYTVPANQAVVDFSDSCQGKSDELSDVANNRINFHILSGTYSDVSVDLNADRTFADVSGTCVFHDIPLNPSAPFYGKSEKVQGICSLTAVYENWRWWLCDSHFRGIPGVPVVPDRLRFRVPGRIVQP